MKPPRKYAPIPNARFWAVTPNAELVKLTLRPGQVLLHFHFQRDDEGHTRSTDAYHHTGGAVRLDWITSAKDCDGMLDRAGTLICPLDRLRAKPQYLCQGWPALKEGDFYHPTELNPDWVEAHRTQRDHPAEAAGY